MTVLAWQRAGDRDAPTVALLHAWGRDALGGWQATGWAPALEEAGFAVCAADLPGHGDSSDVPLGRAADAAAWTAGVVAADLRTLGIRSVAVVGAGIGAAVAVHVAAKGEVEVTRLALLATGFDVSAPDVAAASASALRDPRSSVWRPEAAAVLAGARGGRHDPRTLADWLEHCAWPAHPRLRAVTSPVLLASDELDGGPVRDLAARFADARVVSVAGRWTERLGDPQLVALTVSFLAGD